MFQVPCECAVRESGDVCGIVGAAAIFLFALYYGQIWFLILAAFGGFLMGGDVIVGMIVYANYARTTGTVLLDGQPIPPHGQGWSVSGPGGAGRILRLGGSSTGPVDLTNNPNDIGGAIYGAVSNGSGGTGLNSAT